MSTSALSLCVCFLTCFLKCSTSADIKADPGDDVVLHCQGPRDADIVMVEWTKPDLKSEDYVFFLRDGQRFDEYQHPSFHGRVKLRDPTVTDGDASLVLKNVDMKDAGTYECYAATATPHRSQRSAPELVSSITLKVEHSDQIHMTAKPGETFTLQCHGITNAPVTGVEWVRSDLVKAGYVFKSQDGRSVPENQHPYYKNMVQLKDAAMKDGDASLVLNTVMTTDSGTYECYVTQGGTRRMMTSIHLEVTPPAHAEDGGHEA